MTLSVKARSLRSGESFELSIRGASLVAKSFGFKRPRVGYEVELENDLYLTSTGHHQFGWFGLTETHPYRVWRY